MDAILVEGLRKRYKQVQAVDGVSFAVREGEIFGLLGPNGAGKSTIVRVLATLTTVGEGRAEVAGHDVRHDPAGVRRAIGYVPQESGVDREATGRENLLLQGRIQGVRGAALRLRVDELLDGLGLAHAADRQARTYSGGMRRRLDVALGLVHRPAVLLLDEPTTGLDPEARAALWEELERLAHEETLTILLTTHYLEEADRLAGRLVIVSRGTVVVEGTLEALKQTLRGDSVTVELDAGDGARAQAAVAALAEVHEAVLDGGQLRAFVEHGPRAVATIVSALDAAAVSIHSVTIARPSLDEVYLHYTGRDFRAEDAEAVAAAAAPADGRGGRGTLTAVRIVAHTWWMIGRQLRNLAREPIWIALLLIQPMIWLLLYGQLFRKVVELPGFGDVSYVAFLTPGIVVMNAFSAAPGAGWR